MKRITVNIRISLFNENNSRSTLIPIKIGNYVTTLLLFTFMKYHIKDHIGIENTARVDFF